MSESSPQNTPGTLAGIKVIDMSRLLPGPYCSMILADHGARVIAVESRRFEKEAFFFKTVYRNKEHMTLDLKNKDGRKIFFNLVADADVFLEGFRPEVADRLGIGYEALSVINPGIVYCSISGYGQTGPWHDRPGHDVNFLATAGVLDMIGEATGPPVIPAVQIADIAGGGMNAVTGILLALFDRTRTGRGQHIDISMSDGLLGFLMPPLSQLQARGRRPERGNSRFSHRYAWYNVYRTADDRYIAIGALEPRFWKTLCEHLQVPEYIDLQYDKDRRREIIDRLRSVFRAKPLSRWKTELDSLEICWSPVQTMEEALDDPLFRRRNMILETPAGRTIGVPVKLSRCPGSVRTTPPAFGEHTRAILKELGYHADQIEDFFNRGVV